MTSRLLARLEARVASGEIELDAAQMRAATHLARLETALQSWKPARGWSLGSLFGAKPARPPLGLYIHGKVGRGKTMLMDLFFASVEFAPKRRIHFHEFMAETHDLIGEARKKVDGDPIPYVAAQLAEKAGLLCFDEFHVTDIADAMILGRLFAGLWEKGVVVVATSNVHPTGLYQNGLNRQLFLPFIDLLMRNMEVIELEAAKDYRLEKLAGQPLYFTPNDDRAKREIRAAFMRLTGVPHGTPTELEVKGRKVAVPEAAGGVARFSFSDLCSKPLGALDYLHIAHAFHTVMIEDIPRLVPARRNEARRLVNLIDTLYDNHVGLIASAEAEPDELYPAGDAAFLFERTASRLIELRSAAYLQDRGNRLATAAE